MTAWVALSALGAALLAWPVRRRDDVRLRALVTAQRLADGGVRGRVGVSWVARLRALPTRLAVCVVAAASGVGGALWRGPLLGIACGVAGLVAVASGARAARGATDRARDRELSAALRLLRAELEVGGSPANALAAAASVAGGYRAAFEAGAVAARDGADVAAAMSASTRQLAVVAQAWQLAGTVGVPLAGVLARVDDDVQARRAQSRATATALAGPRASAALLAGLPVLGVLLGAAMGAHPLYVLLDSTAGRLMLCGGVLLDAAGVVWTARLVDAAERS